MKFLEALRDGNTVKAAAAQAGLSRQAFYLRRNTDHVFAAEWDEAVDEGTDVLEDVAFRRALDGSDRLLIFLLKARRPEKFRDTYEGADSPAAQRDQHIAEAIDRFTSTVVQLASRSRAELSD